MNIARLTNIFTLKVFAFRHFEFNIGWHKVTYIGEREIVLQQFCNYVFFLKTALKIILLWLLYHNLVLNTDLWLCWEYIYFIYKYSADKHISLLYLMGPGSFHRYRERYCTIFVIDKFLPHYVSIFLHSYYRFAMNFL